MPSPRNTAPFRAEHIGSFRRPDKLVEKRTQFSEGLCTREELRLIEDDAIKELVELQTSSGIMTITDGEFRREAFMNGVYDKVEGSVEVTDLEDYMFLPYVPFNAPGMYSRRKTCICTGKLKRTRPLYEDEYNGLAKFLSPEERKYIKIDICTPEWFHFKHGVRVYERSGVYTNDAEYFADIAKIYQEEIRHLYNIGLRNLQIDDPLLTFFCDENITSGMRKQGIDPDALFKSYINLLKDCLKDRPMDMNIGIHLCRGNVKAGYVSGTYDRIASSLLTEVPVDCFYLEYDTDKAGGFEPLKHLPKDKIVVLGIVSTKLTELEDREELKRKIYEAANTITQNNSKRTLQDALNQICISPQCGFSTILAAHHALTEEQTKEKLKLLVDTAKEIWG